MNRFKHYLPPSTKIPFHSNNRFHVFLSFRGRDVRKTLVDHLYQALSAAGLHVFLDSHKLKRGEIIDLSLEVAIESSSICIPIFSKGYASSAWCLREAVFMLRSEGLIIPLFYDVEPTHVRYPQSYSSPYAEAFRKHSSHSDRYEKGEIDGWKDALQQICSRSGWSMEITAGFEGQLVKKVVSDVISTLDSVPLDVAKHPVGLENVKNDIIQKLNIYPAESHSTSVRVGILGIGGIGKTTVAKAVYNEVYRRFDASCFLFNVRSTAEKVNGLMELQGIILNDLTHYRWDVRSVDHGKTLMRDVLGGIRGLLILDDVNHRLQLEALAGNWMAPGSRVIITTRDQHILNVAQVSSEFIQEMSGLMDDEALQLFCWHAFMSSFPTEKYKDVSRRIVEACHGHPLSLEVIGALLYDKQNGTGIECWNETVNNIASNEDIFKTLLISYSALTNEEKEIFLDIACFFIGENSKYPILFWRSLYNSKVSTALANLTMKLLIKIDNEGTFYMHSHLRDMGRKIAEKESLVDGCTRAWEDIADPTQHMNICSLRFILRGGQPQKIKMWPAPKLRYLHMENVHIEQDIGKLTPNLIWLRLSDCYFPSKMHGSGLLKHPSFLKKPPGFSFVGKTWQLRIIELAQCSGLKSLPYSIGNLLQLQCLKLLDCNDLRKIPSTIGNLSQLHFLTVSRCQNIRKLPSAIGNLSELHKLDLSWCKCLEDLPDTIGNLSQLHDLNLSGCVDLQGLPDRFGILVQLHFLSLYECKSLKKLPDTFGRLSQLQSLELSSCYRLERLPNTIGALLQLKSLKVIMCSGLRSLPDTIGNLTELESLNLFNCNSMERLPNTIGNLSQLKLLKLVMCSSLQSLPDTIGNMRALECLELSSCSHLERLPNTIGNLSQLKSLKLDLCNSLQSLPEAIGNLSQLEHLDLWQCYDLHRLPSAIDNLLHLRYLRLPQAQETLLTENG